MSANNIATNAAARTRKPMLDGANSAAQATSEGRILKAIRRHKVLWFWEAAPIARPQ